MKPIRMNEKKMERPWKKRKERKRKKEKKMYGKSPIRHREHMIMKRLKEEKLYSCLLKMNEE